MWWRHAQVIFNFVLLVASALPSETPAGNDASRSLAPYSFGGFIKEVAPSEIPLPSEVLLPPNESTTGLLKPLTLFKETFSHPEDLEVLDPLEKEPLMILETQDSEGIRRRKVIVRRNKGKTLKGPGLEVPAGTSINVNRGRAGGNRPFELDLSHSPSSGYSIAAPPSSLPYGFSEIQSSPQVNFGVSASKPNSPPLHDSRPSQNSASFGFSGSSNSNFPIQPISFFQLVQHPSQIGSGDRPSILQPFIPSSGGMHQPLQPTGQLDGQAVSDDPGGQYGTNLFPENSISIQTEGQLPSRPGSFISHGFGGSSGGGQSNLVQPVLPLDPFDNKPGAYLPAGFGQQKPQVSPTRPPRPSQKPFPSIGFLGSESGSKYPSITSPPEKPYGPVSPAQVSPPRPVPHPGFAPSPPSAGGSGGTSLQQFNRVGNEYSYEYSVNSPGSGDVHQANESRDRYGVVRGQYSLVQPDGRIRQVTYTADDVNGFRAKVKYFPAK